MKSPSCTGHESKHYRFTNHQNKQPRIRPTVHSKESGESPTKKFYTQSPSSALGWHFFATFSESLYFECVSPILIHLIHSSPVIFWCLWGNALNLACHARDNALCAVAAWKDCLTCWRRMARIRGGLKMETGPTTTKFQAKHCLFTRLYCVSTENQIESGSWKTMRIHCLQKEPLYQNLRISRIMTWFRSTGTVGVSLFHEVKFGFILTTKSQVHPHISLFTWMSKWQMLLSCHSYFQRIDWQLSSWANGDEDSGRNRFGIWRIGWELQPNLLESACIWASEDDFIIQQEGLTARVSTTSPVHSYSISLRSLCDKWQHFAKTPNTTGAS